MNLNCLSPIYENVEKSREVAEFLEQDRKETNRWYDQQDQHFANYSYSADVGFVDENTLFPGESPEKVLLRKEAFQALQELLDSQDEVRLRRLRLYFDAGLTYAEIAKREHVTECAVRHQMERTLRDMRLHLSEAGYSLSDFETKGGFVPFKIPTKRTQEKMEAAALERRAEEVAQKSENSTKSKKIA